MFLKLEFKFMLLLGNTLAHFKTQDIIKQTAPQA
jgi:hypothetical protein